MSLEREHDSVRHVRRLLHVLGASGPQQMANAVALVAASVVAGFGCLASIGGAAGPPLGASPTWSDLHALATAWSARGRYILLDLENRVTEKLHIELLDLAHP